MTEYFGSKDGAAFIQYEPGGEVYAVGNCVTVDSLPNPSTDSEPVFCFDDDRNYEVVAETLTPPGKPSLAVTTLVEEAASYLELVKEAGCPFNFYVTTALCGKKSVFLNYGRAWVYRNCRFSDDAINSPVMRDSDAMVEHAFSITGWPGRIDHRPLTFARIATTETAVLNDIQACARQCPSGCGEYIEMCEQLWVAADTVAAAIPDVLRSVDRGLTWTSPASGFAAGESVKAVSCIEVGGSVRRLVTVRDTDAGAALEVGYSDDNGVTWTMVAVGTTVAEAAVGGGSMFFLDPDHGWICTDDGRVFFSSDNAATWTDQTTALAASGANALNAIHFSDANIGYAVGASDTVIATTDGGTNWVAATATGSGDGLNCVHVFDQYRLIVGTDSVVSASPLYMSFDGTTNWTTITEGLAIAATDTVEDVTFLADGLTGYLLKNTSAPVGTPYKSIDGGRSWSAINAVTNSGLNSIYACNANLAFVVGEVSAATSFIGSITG